MKRFISSSASFQPIVSLYLKGFILLSLMVNLTTVKSQTWSQILKESGEMGNPSAGGRNAGENFGYSVAISGDYAVVGAKNDDESATGSGSNVGAGAVFVFKKVNSDWILHQKLVASDRKEGDLFGHSVAIHNNVIVVGAIGKDTSFANILFWNSVGAAYVFELTNGHWTEVKKIMSSDFGDMDEFGYSLVVKDSTIVIGAYSEDHDLQSKDAKASAGSAYIFKRINNDWIQVQKIVASDREENDYFGYDISMSGDFIFVGAYNDGHDENSANFLQMAGSVYVFRYTNGWWVESQKIVPSDREAIDRFGISVAVYGNRAVIGATFEDHDGSNADFKNNAGSAYVFELVNNTWVQEQKLLASDRANNDNFGIDVAINNDVIVVSTVSEDHDALGGNFLTNSGSAYVFKHNGSNWAQNQKIVSSDRAEQDLFGYSIAVDSNNIIIGSHQEDEDTAGFNTKSNSGSAYVFNDQNSSYIQVEKLIAFDRAQGDRFAYNVCMDGEFAAVGSPFEDDDENGENSRFDAGAVYMYQKDSGTWKFFQKLMPLDRGESNYFGSSVSIDSHTMIIGAYGDTKDSAGLGSSLVSAGSAYIFIYKNGVWQQEFKIMANDRQSNDNFGQSVAINNGYAIVGAPWEDHDENGLKFRDNAGSAYIFKKVNSRWVQQKKFVSKHREATSLYGLSVSIHGNTAVVGSSYEDTIATGSPVYYNAGAAYVYHLNNGEWNFKTKLVASDASHFYYFGTSVSVSDKYVVVGAPGASKDASGQNILASAGTVYVFELISGNWVEKQKLMMPERVYFARFGAKVYLKDSMLVISAVENDNIRLGMSALNSGSSFIFKNRNNSFELQYEIVSDDILAGDYFGHSIAIDGGYILAGCNSKNTNRLNQDFLEYTGMVYFFKDLGNIAQMRVLGRNKPIKDNDLMADTADNTDFGALKVLNSKSHTFKIFNTGTDTLRISNLQFSGLNPTDFKFQNLNLPIKIKGGDSLILTIEFNPLDTGLRQSAVLLYTNDDFIDTFQFAIEGYGTQPLIKILGNNQHIMNGDNLISALDYTDFGKVKKMSSANRKFKIVNEGTDTLKIKKITFSGQDSFLFSNNLVILNELPIAPGDTFLFDIKFIPNSKGYKYSTVKIVNNVNLNGLYTYLIGGEGIGPEMRVIGNGKWIANGKTNPELSDYTSFGQIVKGTQMKRQYWVKNLGNDTLLLSKAIVSGMDELYFQTNTNQQDTLILPDDSTSFNIILDSDSVGLKTTTVSLSSDDPSNNNYQFDIAGEILPVSSIWSIQSQASVDMYPNPADGQFNLQLNGFTEAISIQVYTINGSLVLNYPDVESDTFVIGSSTLPNGVYFVKVVLSLGVFNAHIVIAH